MKKPKKRGSKSSKNAKKLYQDTLGELVESVAGKPGIDILKILADKPNVNEFLIAKILHLTINQTRNILYKLSDRGIVSFSRKKDKRKGWYTYFWTLDVVRAIETAESRIKEFIKNLQNQKKNRESRRFYICKACSTEVSEETALLNNFTCQECGKVYELNESGELLKDIYERTSRFQSELERIREVLGTERTKVKKKIDLKGKREKEKKKILRKQKMNEKARNDRKLERKLKRIAERRRAKRHKMKKAKRHKTKKVKKHKVKKLKHSKSSGRKR